MSMSRLLAAVASALLTGCASTGSTLATEATPTASRQSEAAAPGPSAALDAKPGQQVVLHHCGVLPVNYDGRQWEVEQPPFDLTNAPDTYSGFGEFTLDGDTLHFADRDGARLDFTVEDHSPPPDVCA
jgi:hypothetical protein